MTGWPWLSYVPYGIAADIVNAGMNPLLREQRQGAVAMFADVSGFTAISEALAQAGRAGTEELTRILNDYFETMIALVCDYGGIVGQFGGDALTVLFPYTPATQTITVRRAIRCALAMQDAMDRYTSIQTRVGAYQLSFKAGLADGRMVCLTVGDLDVGLKSVVAGGAMDLCADAEHVAARGEVVLHHNLLPHAGAVELVPKTATFSRVLRLDEDVSLAPLPPLERDLDVAQQRTLQAFLHPVIAERLLHDQHGFVNEHRSVTVMFVQFTGFDFDNDPEVGHDLRVYLGEVLRIVQRYDGYLNKVDMGDKGSKVIILFGAPVGHEDDEERALRCALELRALVGVSALTGLSIRIGINTGMAFCGLIGAEVRQEYTVIGDAVNLAARLMQVAPTGQIYVSAETRRIPAREFTWTQLAPLTVKGKTEPVEAYTLDSTRGRAIMQTQEFDYMLPMVGRMQEFALAEAAIERVLDGHGQVIGITADAGMGKTRLNAEIIRVAVAQGLKGFVGECESYGTTTPYLVWHNVWRTFFDTDGLWPANTVRQLLEMQLAIIDPGLIGRLPLLGAALNIPLPDNELTAGLDAKSRKASLEALLIACVRARAAEQPLLIVLEDVHWIDPLSFDLLRAIVRNIADVPVLLLMLYRPPELAHIDLAEIRRVPYFTELALAEFTPEEAETLIELKLERLFGSTRTAPPELVRLITARAQGNPFYIDEMLNLLQDQGIDPHNVAALAAADLPDSLHSLIISRIDRLLEDLKITLKVASVIGRIFRADWLSHVYPGVGDRLRVQEQLNSLHLHNFLTAPDAAGDRELEYLFKHVVTQEVAYESLAVATRARLHEQIAAYIESTYPDTLDRYFDLLAFHYGHSANRDKKREYFRLAGEAAQQHYANAAAIEYFQRLIVLLPSSEQPEIYLRLGEIWQLIGAWDASLDAYRTGLDLAVRADDITRQAELRNKLGHLQTVQGAYDTALMTLQTALEQFEQLDDDQGMGKALGNLGSLYLYQGEPAQAIEYYERALPAATAGKDRALAATILGNWGVAHNFLGDHMRALVLFQQQLQIREMLGLRRDMAISRNNIGLAYEDQGDYVQALENYQACLLGAAEVGDQTLLGLAAGNIGILYTLQGRGDLALRCLAVQLAIGLETGDRRLIGLALADSADAFKQQDDAASAHRLYRYAITLARVLNLRFDLGSFLHRQADLLLRQEDYGGAQPLCAEAATVAQGVGRQDVIFGATLQTIRCRVGLHQIDADTASAELAALADQWTGDDQLAALHFEQWRLHASHSARDRAAALYRDLFAETPNAEYAARYRVLTGERLPDPPELPPLPAVIAQRARPLEALLARVEDVIAAHGE